jgi:DNA-binding transcriptional LysR family regulator
MELEQLRQLVAVADAGTMSKAAEELHISQPVISRSMRQLEADLGQELFDRTRNRVALNDAGRITVDAARKILADVQVLRDDLDDYAKRMRTVRVGTCAPAPLWVLTERAVAKFPGVIFSTEFYSEQDLERALINRAVDLALLRRPLALPTIATRQVMTENLFVEVPPESDLAGRDHVGWDDLNGRPFLIMEAIGFWMDVVRDHLPDSQLIVQTDRTVFRQLIETSQLLSFATEASSFERPETDRARIPIWEPDASATFFIAAQADADPRITGLLGLF